MLFESRLVFNDSQVREGYDNTARETMFMNSSSCEANIFYLETIISCPFFFSKSDLIEA